eukprot:2318368-Karenia_brevis.AAC.1
MVWASAIQEEIKDVKAEAYADDTQAITSTRHAITKTAGITDDFARLTNQRIHASRSYAYTVVPGA